VGGVGPDEATLKVRGPGAPDAASRFLATAGGGAKFEGDQNVGREEAPSFSITTELGSASHTRGDDQCGKTGIRPERSRKSAAPRNE